jgi:lysophospholipid acyltransferase (LPLAT)-like uncharacterized protein
VGTDPESANTRRDWTPKEEFLLRSGSLLGAGLVRTLGMTWRLSWVGEHHRADLERSGSNWIYAFWHGWLLALIYTHRNKGIKVLVSTHRDGELVARLIAKLGFGVVRGSTTRGGGRALFALAALRDEAPLGVAPDGPRGPARQVHPGVIYLAQRSGLPIVPLTSASNPCWRANSWDRFVVPLPFARCAIGYGEPLWVPPHAGGVEIERLRAELQGRLDSLQRSLEDLVGLPEKEVKV